MKTLVIIKKNHTIVIPASVLETRYSSDGPVVQSILVPEQKLELVAGKQCEFRSKKDAKAFIESVGTDVACIKA